MPLDETAKRYKAHNDAIERSQKNLSAPPGKKCIEVGCTNGAFPWDKRCRSCEKKHQRALRSANRNRVPCSPFAFEHLVAFARGGLR